MNIRHHILCSLAPIIMSAFAMGAAAPDLPPDAIGADTVFVMHADAQHLTPDLLRAASFAALGDNADRAKDFLTRFNEKYDKAIRAGVKSITIVGTSGQRVTDAGKELDADPNDPNKRPPPNPPLVYFHTKGAGAAKAIEAVVTKDMPAAQREPLQFEEADDWVVMHEKTQNPPDKPDAARAKAFSDALISLGEPAVAVAIIPDARSRQTMLQQSKDKKAARFAKVGLPAVADMKWLTVAATLGNNPSVNVAFNAADEKSARDLKAAIDAQLDEIKQQIAGGEGPMLILGPMLTPVLESLRPNARGSFVTTNVSGDGLTSIANLIVTSQVMFERGQQAPTTKPAAPTGKPTKK